MRFHFLPLEVLKAHGNTIQLATADMGQDGSGYLFDTGNLNEGSLATASLSDDGTSLSLGSNRSDAGESVPGNESQVLGNGSVAPIFALVDPLKGVGTPWLFPLAGLLVGLLLCISSYSRVPFIAKKRGRRVPVNIAPAHVAFVLWVVSATILAVRVVLSFRVSMLPPFNMDAVSAASFRGSWTKAWLPALFIPPFIGLLTFAVVRAKQPAAQQPWTELIGGWTADRLSKISKRPWHFLSRTAYGLALLLAVLMILQKMVHFPFPDVVLVGVLLLIVGLVFDGVGEARDDDYSERGGTEQTTEAKLDNLARRHPWGKRMLSDRQLWERNPLLWCAAILLLFLDPGSFLFFVPLSVALCVGGMIAAFGQKPAESDDGLNRRAVMAKAALFAILGSALLGIVFAAPIGNALMTNSTAGKVFKNAAFPYRLAATNAAVADHMLVDPATKNGSFDPHRMEETLHQRWQMLAYQSANGAGYFGAPLSNVGMTYPTTLSDAAFSVYLVGEHGHLAGVMVIGLLLALAFAMFRAAWLAASSRNQKANARGLYAIGGVFGCASVYMALANLWVIPFTGQNVPFLSLNSWKDLVLNGTLLVAAILLIAYPGSWSSQTDPAARKDAAKNAVGWWAFPGLLAFGWLFLSANLMLPGGDPAHAFNLSSSTLSAVQQTVDSAQEEVGQRQIPLEETAAIRGASPFIRSVVANFDSGQVTKTPIVEARRAGSRLSVDKRFYLLRSPFDKDPGVAWHGALTAVGHISRHQLVVGGSRVPIVLESGRGAGQIFLGKPVKPMTVQTIDIKQLEPLKNSRRLTSVDYGGIKLDGNRVMLRWKDFGKPGSILVNGKIPDLKFNELEINESDIVSLEYTGPDGIPLKLSLHYLGPTESKLASVVWRNGRFSRTFPQGADFPLAYTIGEIGDEVARTAPKKPGNVQLSVDMQLQRDLETELRSWARSRSRLVDRGSTMPDGLPFTAVSVLDSMSGQIRALAALPQVDPREDFGHVEDRFLNESDALIASHSSWTLVNRTIGSTIKPLSFSALNSQLDSKTFDLTKLHVSETAAVEFYVDKDGRSLRAYRQLGDIHLKRGKGLGSKENPRQDVDMFTYLKDSRTWPAIVTSTIGLVADKSHPAEMKDELSKMLTPSSRGPLSMDGQRLALHPWRSATSPVSKRDDGLQRRTCRHRLFQRHRGVLRTERCAVQHRCGESLGR